MAPPPLVERHIAAQARIRKILEEAVALRWENLRRHDEANVQEWLSQVLPQVEAAQRQSVALMDAYLAAQMGRPALGIDPEPLMGANVRNGTSPEEVYRRPFVTFWSALGDHTFDEALQFGLDRATSTAGMDAQLSMRGAASAIGERDTAIQGFERVPDGDACELCLIASTQRYHVEDLMPIHNNCGCSVQALDGAAAASGVINRDLYRELKARGAMDKITAQRRSGRYRQRATANREKADGWAKQLETETDSARRARLEERADRYRSRADQQEAKANAVDAGEVNAKVVEHGELGPVLVNADHTFTTL